MSFIIGGVLRDFVKLRVYPEHRAFALRHAPCASSPKFRVGVEFLK